MPRRGRGNRNYYGDTDNRGPKDSRHEGRKYYSEHDTRGADLTRRVSFKAGTSNRIGKPKRRPDWDKTLQSRLGIIDEDIDMSGQGTATQQPRRFTNMTIIRGGRGRGGVRGGRQGSPPNLQRKLVDGGPTWYQIRIPHGNKYEKDYIIQVLQGHIAPMPLVPFMYMTTTGDCSFYVDSFDVASRLQEADRRITTSEGFKLLVRCRPAFPPVQLTDVLRQKMKLAMAARYNAPNKALDLEKFHMDPNLVNDSAVALFRPNLMLEALDIIATNIPDVRAISLTDNKISHLNHLNVMATKLPHLNILHLGKNMIRDIRQMDSLKDLPLTELVLDGNPLCDRFKERSLYVSKVTEKFPKLLKLDGVELPARIKFETEDETALPDHVGSFFVSAEGRDFVRQFLEQYMRIYDSDDRTPLQAAYHEQASLALTAAASNDGPGRLDAYIPVSRNLLRVKDSARRHKFLHVGREQIVNFLCQLPATSHDPLSFAVDMPIYSPQLIQVCVSGVFKERGEAAEGRPTRSFSRVFVIVPVGGGFCVVNEAVFITNATTAQIQCAFRAASQPTQPNLTLKEQMLQALQGNTKMNLTWANKCLEETNWNYDLALASFTQLNEAKAIPAEAFVKSEPF